MYIYIYICVFVTVTYTYYVMHDSQVHNIYIHIIYTHTYIDIYIYKSATTLLVVRHPVAIQYPCGLLFSNLVVLVAPYEALVDKGTGSLGLGDHFWVNPGPEAGHGGNCFGEPSPPHPLLLAVTRGLSLHLESVKKQHF